MTVHSGRGWRLAPSLIALEDEANRLAPRRSQRSDGSIGDRSHRNRRSKHNPSGGWVHALDLTHDPRGGFDAHAHARAIAARNDARVENIISNRMIWSAGRGWRRYTGSNPHTSHAHIDVHETNAARNNTTPWLGAPPPPPLPARPPNKREMAFTALKYVKQMPDLHPGNKQKNLHVIWLQRALNIARGAGLADDGMYGDRTVLAVAAFQHDLAKFGVENPDRIGHFERFTRWYLAAALHNIATGKTP